MLLVEHQKDSSDLNEKNSVACYYFKKLLFLSSLDILLHYGVSAKKNSRFDILTSFSLAGDSLHILFGEFDLDFSEGVFICVWRFKGCYQSARSVAP